MKIAFYSHWNVRLKHSLGGMGLSWVKFIESLGR